MCSFVDVRLRSWNHFINPKIFSKSASHTHTHEFVDAWSDFVTNSNSWTRNPIIFCTLGQDNVGFAQIWFDDCCWLPPYMFQNDCMYKQQGHKLVGPAVGKMGDCLWDGWRDCHLCAQALSASKPNLVKRSPKAADILCAMWTHWQLCGLVPIHLRCEKMQKARQKAWELQW